MEEEVKQMKKLIVRLTLACVVAISALGTAAPATYAAVEEGTVVEVQPWGGGVDGDKEL